MCGADQDVFDELFKDDDLTSAQKEQPLPHQHHGVSQRAKDAGDAQKSSNKLKTEKAPRTP